MINGVRYTYYPGGGGRGAFYEAKFETEEERKKAKESLKKAAKIMNRNVDFDFSYHEYLEEKLGVSVPIYPLGYGAGTVKSFPLGITEEGVKKLEGIKVAQINHTGGGKRRKSKRKSSEKSKRRKRSKRKSSKRSSKRRR